MKAAYLLSTLFTLSEIPTGQAFQPSLARKARQQTVPLKSAVNPDLFNQDPVNKIDMKHAHECAENFGECSIAELEYINQGMCTRYKCELLDRHFKIIHIFIYYICTHAALKVERIQHGALGLTLDPEEDLDHRILEQDLAAQLSLLKEEMYTTSLDNEEKSDVKPAHDNVVAAIANPDYYHHDHTLQDFVEQGEELFLLPNGLSDAFAIGAALLIIAATPYLVSSP
jgi:hypothetical protein